MKALLFAALAFISPTVASSATAEQSIQIAGVLSERIFPGRPNYESIASGDEAEKVWILTTTEGKPPTSYQLVVVSRDTPVVATLRRSSGKTIMVTGTISEADTGHHHTNRLIVVRSIEVVREN